MSPAAPPLARLAGDFARSRSALAALAFLAAVAIAALLAPWLAPQDPYDLAALDLAAGRMPPGSRSPAGMTFWLGSDDQGRDMLSAILYGLRVSVAVGVGATLAALAIGASAGLVAAWAGGRTDSVIMRIVDIQLSFPAILVALVLLAVLGQGTGKIVLALVAAQWAYYARTVRGAALAERRKEYVDAAMLLALPRARILFRHLLPNVLAPLLVVATVQVANAIALEATLSFLGLGVPITEPSLGLLIAAGHAYLLSGQYWMSFFPGVALAATIVAVNLVGDRLRDVLNPRLER